MKARLEKQKPISKVFLLGEMMVWTRVVAHEVRRRDSGLIWKLEQTGLAYALGVGCERMSQDI